jgi:hypothetical protein
MDVKMSGWSEVSSFRDGFGWWVVGVGFRGCFLGVGRSVCGWIFELTEDVIIGRMEGKRREIYTLVSFCI